jgi:hypothetical protein
MRDICIRLPWINRRRPFIAFHIAPFPACQIRRGYIRLVYHCGIIWGRQFMPNNNSSHSFWFDIPMMWRKAKP